MITVENLTVSFGATPLFARASFVVNDRDRIALVGKNGAGKSTLLKILCGQQTPTSGTVSIPSDTTIGYLPQVMRLTDHTTVREETRKAFSETTRLKQQVENMQLELSSRTDTDSADYLSLINRFTQAHERYQMLGGDNIDADIERTLSGLGFLPSDFDRPTGEFSGGWRMRIELAKILLRRPDVLLLDEPTNPLDINSIQWLEQFIAQSSSAVVLVSHDRAFINNVTRRTLEISCGNIIDYRVRYDEYVVLREERREQQRRAYENQQREIADMTKFIERFRYQATKAVQVQQKIKQLEKIVPIQIDEVDRPAMHLRFPPCQRSGDFPIICDEVSKAYGSHTVFSHATFTLRRGEKVAFVGRNGEGKTTMVRCIMNEIPFDGTLKIGHNVQIGYFAQNQAQLLDEGLTVFETIDREARGEVRLRINDILGAFMFGGEASEKKVRVLSGGERSRLAMIKLLLQPVNLLILDEPTNHLDMASKEVLKQAILAFDGTAIIVSHDRQFLDGLVSKVYAFADGHMCEHLGGIYDWLQQAQGQQPQPHRPTPSPSLKWRGAESFSNRISEKRTICPPIPSEARPPVASPHREAQGVGLQEEASAAETWADRKARQRRISQMQKAVRQSETLIAELEARLAQLGDQLSQPENVASLELASQYAEVQQQLDAETDRWLQLSEELCANTE